MAIKMLGQRFRTAFHRLLASKQAHHEPSLTYKTKETPWMYHHTML